MEGGCFLTQNFIITFISIQYQLVVIWKYTTRTKKDLNKAVDVIRSLGIEENVRKQALKYAEKAEKSLAKYSGSAKTELISLLDFVVKRSV